MLPQPEGSNYPIVRSRRNELTEYDASLPPTPKQTPNPLLVAWTHRWLILICLTISFACGLAYVSKAVPVYGASSVIYVQPSVPKIISDEFGKESISSDYLYTQCQLIESTAILAGAMDVPGVADADCLKGIANPIAFIKTRFSAQPSRQGDLIVLSMESPTPQGAAVIVNGVAQAYIEYQSQVHKSKASDIVRMLQQKMGQYDAELKSAHAEMLKLQKENPELIFQAADGGRPMMLQLSDDLSKANLRLSDLRLALAAATGAQHDPSELRRIISEYQLGDLIVGEAKNDAEAEYQHQKGVLDGMLDRYGPKSQTVIDQRRLVDRLHDDAVNAAETMTTQCLLAVQHAKEIAERRVQQIQAAIDAQRKSMVLMTQKQIEYQQRSDEALRAEKALDSLDSRIKEINPTEEIGSMTVTVLELARPNPIPLRPNRAQAIGISIAAGLLVGMLLGFLRDVFDHRIHTPEEASAALHLSVLGIVPHIADGGEAGAPRGRETALRPRSEVAEAFRSLRTALYLGAHDARLAKTVLLTSPTVGDGKSTTASNLAIAVSQAGRRVLLIDGDCRRPTQDKIFKLKKGPGLSDVLAHGRDFDEVVHKGVFTRLDVLSCGQLPANPAELLDSQAFIELLKTKSFQYDHIFIDSPPVLPVSDARIISAFCEVTILVLRAKHSTRRMAEQSCQILESVGAKLLGIIVNDVSRRQPGYHYPYSQHPSFVNEPVVGNGTFNGHASGSILVAGELVDDG